MHTYRVNMDLLAESVVYITQTQFDAVSNINMLALPRD